MSGHDRGAFGALLARAKVAGYTQIGFFVDMEYADEDPIRWSCTASLKSDGGLTKASGYGRTGEEALRALVEKLPPPERESDPFPEGNPYRKPAA